MSVIDSNATVNSGGTQYISGGGVASDATIDTGGFELVENGGMANGTTLSAGGSEIVSAGGGDFEAVLSRGEQDVYGYAANASVLAGSQVVESAGFALSTVVSSGGVQAIE
jgi:autotransporter passenger strand-loop-strand repeat protein